MPILLFAALGALGLGSGVLLFSKGVSDTGHAVTDTATNLIVPLSGALGLYAAYKVLSKV